MTSLEKLSEQCVSVCEVPISVPKETVLKHVSSIIRHGRIFDSDKVDGIESDKNLTRLVLLLTAGEDVELLCEMKQDEINAEEESFNVRYQKAITCELPERWEEIKMQELVVRQSLFSDEASIQAGPALPSRAQPPSQKPTDRDQHKMPQNPWPVGPYGPMSGIYHNLPFDAGQKLDDGGGLEHTPGQLPPQQQQIQSLPFNQGVAHGQGKDNVPFQRPPGFQGQGQMQGFPYGQFPPAGYLWGMRPNVPHDQQNIPGGHNMQNMPYPPGMMNMRMPMFMDPRSGQWLPMQGFPNMPNQPGGGGRGPAGRPQADQPAGPPPPYNSGEFKGQGQAVGSQAVSDQDEMMQKLKAKVDKENQQEAMEMQEDHPDSARFNEPEKEPGTEEKPTKIVVSNLPSTVHEEYLEMFFENTKKFGGGTVITVDFDEESSSAVVEFEEPEAVDVVMGKCPIKMMGQEVEVEVFKPEEPVPMCTIQVTGPCSIICEEQIDTLEMYFESKKRSGGGDIVDIKYDHENNWVLVTFEEEEIAQRVEERPSHVLKKETLTVKLHVPVKASKKSDKVEKEKSEEKPPEPVRIVKVKGVDKAASRDTVELYFENAKRSGGGVIEDIKSDEEEDDVLYITFTRPEEKQKSSQLSLYQLIQDKS